MAALEIESNPKDPLNLYRNLFIIPKDENQVSKTYLCGHSLGLQPINTKKEIDRILQSWALNGVRAHFEGPDPWIDYPKSIESKMAQLVGAEKEEVCLMNGLSVNLHLLLQSFYIPQKNRTKILMEAPCFPSDRYIVTSHLKTRGFNPEKQIILWQRNTQTNQFEMEDLLAIFSEHGEEIALVMLGAVNYNNGALLNLEEITKTGHHYGCLVGFDLAHAVGNVALQLGNWNIDFAAWCTYKYLNGGPGSLGGIFINKNHWLRELPRLEGWWGNSIENRFEMKPQFKAAIGASAWQLSNPPVLAMAALKSSMEIFEVAGMKSIRTKSIYLTRHLQEQLLGLEIKDLCITTPENNNERGAMITFSLGEKTYPIFQHLLDHQVVVDYRKPDLIRVAPAPLYNRIEDVAHFIKILKESLYLNRLN